MKTIDTIIADYKSAYLRANGETIKMWHKRGYFYNENKLGIACVGRKADILIMTQNLLARPVFGSQESIDAQRAEFEAALKLKKSTKFIVIHTGKNVYLEDSQGVLLNGGLPIARCDEAKWANAIAAALNKTN